MTHPSPSRHRYETTLLEAARDPTETPCFVICAFSEFPSPTSHGPSTLALGGQVSAFVYRELTERVAIVIVIVIVTQIRIALPSL